jgi:hypothetical protein
MGFIDLANPATKEWVLWCSWVTLQLRHHWIGPRLFMRHMPYRAGLRATPLQNQHWKLEL